MTRTMAAEDRFWPKVREADPADLSPNGWRGCWLWTRATNRDGYGTFNVGGHRIVGAHRFAYERVVGVVPAGLKLDHLCRRLACVNPAHLEIVTHRENCLRGEQGARQRARTHCPSGHAYDGENLYIEPNGKRACRTCQRARVARYEQRKRAEVRAAR